MTQTIGILVLGVFAALAILQGYETLSLWLIASIICTELFGFVKANSKKLRQHREYLLRILISKNLEQ